MGNIEAIKKWVFESDNRACFIERERILARLEKEMAAYTADDKYPRILSAVLSEVSTPILDCDYFAGRVVEALPDEGMVAPSELLWSSGHMSFDYEKLLNVGLKGILEEIAARAKEKGDEASLSFWHNAEIVVYAIKKYADRYAKEAYRKGYRRMGEALEKVPFEPAYDFYSALQSAWLIHMIASCYVGSRDYAFGRFDNYMLPFYEQALSEGETEEELFELLRGFLIKTNEICGRATHNFESKPVPCQASKQYVNVGGEAPNAFSSVVVRAAQANNMAQPQITVLLSPEANAQFTKVVFEALSVLTDKMNIYNYDLVVEALIKKGVPREMAKEFTYSACCTLDLSYHSFRHEYMRPAPQLFLSAFYEREYASLDELVDALKNEFIKDVQPFIYKWQQGRDEAFTKKYFVLDALLLSDSAKECQYACDGNAPHTVINVFCAGIATVGDSLMVLDKLVFTGKRYTYAEFAEILRNNYEDNEALLQEIKGYTMFGNDTDSDRYTVMAGEAFLDAVDALEHRGTSYLIPGFYSLEQDNTRGATLGATPNGRKAGEPFSENQSPTYGADKSGTTALLNSLAKLPFDRTASGGLNLAFSQRVEAEILQALVISYFQMGGLHVGISVIDKEQLLDAMEHPERYAALTVRLYGFSEYFVSLPKWQQVAVLNRTANSV